MADQAKVAAMILAIGVPWWERMFRVLPVDDTVRTAALPAAVLVTILCVIAGSATARHTFSGMQVAWSSLVLFLGVVVVMFGYMDLIPRGERGLYILCFALFGLSVSSFLSVKPYVPVEPPSSVRW
jgi:hypothetical protein